MGDDSRSRSRSHSRTPSRMDLSVHSEVTKKHLLKLADKSVRVVVLFYYYYWVTAQLFRPTGAKTQGPKEDEQLQRRRQHRRKHQAKALEHWKARHRQDRLALRLEGSTRDCPSIELKSAVHFVNKVKRRILPLPFETYSTVAASASKQNAARVTLDELGRQGEDLYVIGQES